MEISHLKATTGMRYLHEHICTHISPCHCPYSHVNAFPSEYLYGVHIKGHTNHELTGSNCIIEYATGYPIATLDYSLLNAHLTIATTVWFTCFYMPLQNDLTLQARTELHNWEGSFSLMQSGTHHLTM